MLRRLLNDWWRRAKGYSSRGGTWHRRGSALALLPLIACAGTTPKPRFSAEPSPRRQMPAERNELLTETTTSSTTTTVPRTMPSRAPKQRTSRSSGNDFWRRLANCESPDGRSGQFIGYFQFSRDTARKVGIDGSESYEEQKAAAQSWATTVDPGSSAGWPICWWRAQ